jgi:uncharacterized membrane protein SpoIIM required for sporulation
MNPNPPPRPISSCARDGTTPVGFDERPGPFAWSWAAFVRCARAFGLTIVVAFVLAVIAGALLPGFPGNLLAALQSITLWPGGFLSRLIPLYFVIVLGNLRAALLMALVGPLSAWINAGLNVRQRPVAGPPGWGARAASAVAAACIRAGRRVFPEVADERRDFAARASAGFAAALPFLALGMNGLVVGLWLADGLLAGWGQGLLRGAAALLPHAPVEFTALLLSAAAGLNGARCVVPGRPEDDCEWQGRAARAWLTSHRTVRSLGLVAGLIAIAAALEMTWFA